MSITPVLWAKENPPTDDAGAGVEIQDLVNDSKVIYK
jgi:hypothetical protein